MPNPSCPPLIAETVALANHRLARERGLDAFYRDEPRPTQAAEAEGWDAAQRWVARARRLPPGLLGPRSAAWLARRDQDVAVPTGR